MLRLLGISVRWTAKYRQFEHDPGLVAQKFGPESLNETMQLGLSAATSSLASAGATTACHACTYGKLPERLKLQSIVRNKQDLRMSHPRTWSALHQIRTQLQDDPVLKYVRELLAACQDGVFGGRFFEFLSFRERRRVRFSNVT